jgi:thiol-disulfide isomerase/thioredoxin
MTAAVGEPGPPPVDPVVPTQLSVSPPPANGTWVPAGVNQANGWTSTADVPDINKNASPHGAPRTLSAVHEIPALGTPTAEPRTRGFGAARVPSCVLVGKQLINLALYDTNGDPWEFRTQRRGKLVLIDFWGTHCGPCREGMPFLRDLSTKYAWSGLEVLGITYELAGSPKDQAQRVSAVCKKYEANYRQLLGSGASCPVRDQFKIRMLPTIVLVDQQGWILWRHEGRLSELDREQLEVIIRRRLGNEQ